MTPSPTAGIPSPGHHLPAGTAELAVIVASWASATGHEPPATGNRPLGAGLRGAAGPIHGAGDLPSAPGHGAREGSPPVGGGGSSKVPLNTVEGGCEFPDGILRNFRRKSAGALRRARGCCNGFRSPQDAAQWDSVGSAGGGRRHPRRPQSRGRMPGSPGAQGLQGYRRATEGHEALSRQALREPLSASGPSWCPGGRLRAGRAIKSPALPHEKAPEPR